jgi:hypothetical protein
MADIDVVPKKRTNTWLWIIVAIVLALIVFSLFGAFSGDTTSGVGQLLNEWPSTTAPTSLAIV